MKTILLTGKTGQLGWELQHSLAGVGHVVALGRQDMDLTDPNAIVRSIRVVRPDIIVNTAAYTDVNRAETEPELAMAINGIAPGIMAEETKRIGALLIHYSTDYVFDGLKYTPYHEEDAPNPLNVYGKTKLAGEVAIQSCGSDFLIFRTAWVYGMHGKNFVQSILKLAGEGQTLRIVDDQFGTPTWSRTIAEFTTMTIAARARGAIIPAGIYHLTAAGSTSRYRFTSAILARGRRDVSSDLRGGRTESSRHRVAPGFCGCGHQTNDLSGYNNTPVRWYGERQRRHDHGIRRQPCHSGDQLYDYGKCRCECHGHLHQ